MLISTLLAAIIGGFIGAALRYLISEASKRFFGDSFPWNTLIVNILGCFIIGSLTGAWAHHSTSLEMQAFHISGICGGLTTFSTFALDGMTLWKRGEWSKSLIYISLTVLLGLGAAWGGWNCC